MLFDSFGPYVYTNMTGGLSTCRIPFQGQRSRSNGPLVILAVRPCVLCCSIVQMLFDSFRPYVYMNTIEGCQCVAYHFKVNRSKFKVKWAFGNFGSPALRAVLLHSLNAIFIYLVYMIIMTVMKMTKLLLLRLITIIIIL